MSGRALFSSVLVCLGLLFDRPAAYALDAAKSLQSYVLDQWDAQHGLPFSTVRAIRQTPDGYLWLGTESGLVRFDGAHFTVFDSQNTPDLGNNYIDSLTVARDGSLWIGSKRGLSRMRPGGWAHYEKDGLLSTLVHTVIESRDGSLWIGSTNGGLNRWNPSPAESYNVERGLSSNSVLTLAEDGEGALWIGTDHGLDRLQNGALRHMDFPDEIVWALLAGRDGSIWVGTEGAGLWHWKDGKFRQFTTRDGLPGNEVRILLEDRDGNLWAGTNYGLGRFANGRWSRLGSEHGLSTNLVRALYEDADGSLWVGYYGGGLSRLRDGELTSVSSREGLAHDLTWGLAEGLDGSLWISTQAGVSRRLHGRWTHYSVKNGLPDDIARPLLRDRSGAIWVGTDKGASRFVDGRWTTVAGLPEGVVQSIHQGRDGTFWFGTWQGLYRMRDGQIQRIEPLKEAASTRRWARLAAILEDSKGQIWVGGSRGLGRVEGDTLVPYLPDAAWSIFPVKALHQDADGALWVGTDGAGLVRIKDAASTVITTRDGLFSDEVLHILEDDAGDFWLGGIRGVFWVSRRALNDFIAGRSLTIAGALFGVAHGMKSSECTGGNSQPGALKDGSGQLWFPTNRGVVMIDPHRARRVDPPPAVHIEDVRLDRLPLAAFGEVEAGPGRGDLEVRYAAINFISPGSVRFRYRLDGSDAAWVDAADRRVAHYANLPPQTYRFAVSASNDGVDWSPEATFQLRLRPRFHQTVWFRGLIVLGIAVAGLGLRRLRARRLAGLLRINEALRESEERYAVAARGGNDGLWDWNLKTGRVYFSPRWKSMLGYAESEIGDDPDEWFGRIHPEDQADVQRHLKSHLEGVAAQFESEHRVQHKSGEYLFVLSRGLVVRDRHGMNVRLAGSQTDITQRKQVEAQILHDALHDPLTGLPNRTLFIDRLSQALARRHRHEDYHFAVLFLDLDRFKLVNDSLGHPAGDDLLVGLARRLSACARIEDTVARLGGDEFAFLLDNIADVASASRMAERIREELRQPFNLGGAEVFSTASIGITFDPESDRRPEDLVRDADTAMYRAKALGRDRHELFDEAMHSRAVAILKLETDLRRALERGELRLLYQPIVDVRTGIVAGFEALVRWNHPERGLLSPDEFIPLAEETGLIVPLGQWVLREACAAARVWQDAINDGPPCSVSVNLSAREFSRTDLVERVRNVLDEVGLAPSRLRLEITESLIMDDPDAAVARCRELRELGVGIDIDDFGTGYSSLSYLRRFPVNALKIDRSFVSRMGDQTGDMEIVRAIINLATTLHIGTVAEGVETREQAEMLRQLGCELGQGYLFAAPLEREEIQVQTYAHLLVYR